MNKTAYILLAGVAGAFLLAACGNPEKSAENTITKVQKDLQKEQSDLNPEHRLNAYDHALKELKAVAKKTKTATGSRIAQGGSVDGVSLAEIQRKRDALAPRAKCYASPTVKCLTPFGSRGANSSSSNSPQSAFALAEELVCSKGFAAADRKLDPFKINKSGYAKELIQVGFAAAKCNKPNEVKNAIGAYMKADPAQGSQRASDLLAILGTKDLSAAHPLITSELESELKSGAISGQGAANVTLTLAIDYAKDGDAKAAMEKYTYFTDTLHYQADYNTANELTGNLVADGDMADALKITKHADDQDFRAVALNQGVTTLARRLDLISTISEPSFDPNDFSGYFAPLDAKTKAQAEAAANAIEAEYDKMAPVVRPTGQTVGNIGIDLGYGILSVVRQKLGEPDKAKAALNKADAFRTRVGQGDYNLPHDAMWRILLDVGNGDAVTAANDFRAARFTDSNYSRVIYNLAGRTLDAEKAISVINTITNGGETQDAFDVVVTAMSKAGKKAEVEKLLGAYSGDPRYLSRFYWEIIDGMIAQGDVSGAKSFAEKKSLVKDDHGRYGLDERLIAVKKIAQDRGKAEPIIREMFKIGEASDKKSNASGEYNNSYARGQSMEAQAAADTAFENGYTDLGIELYQKATYKDHRPLLQAFTDKISKGDMTKVLMLAQDNAGSPQYLSYVIDRAIRHLQTKG